MNEIHRHVISTNDNNNNMDDTREWYNLRHKKRAECQNDNAFLLPSGAYKSMLSQDNFADTKSNLSKPEKMIFLNIILKKWATIDETSNKYISQEILFSTVIFPIGYVVCRVFT